MRFFLDTFRSRLDQPKQALCSHGSRIGESRLEIQNDEELSNEIENLSLYAR
jgi:hypothetical protein